MRAFNQSLLLLALAAGLTSAAPQMALAQAGGGGTAPVTGGSTGMCSTGGCVPVAPCVSGTVLCSPFPDHPAYDPNVEFRKGAAAMRAGNYQEAKREFAKVLYMSPTNSDVLFAMGVADVALGDVAGGADAFEKSLKWNPKQINSARELAIADLKLGQSAKADAQLSTLKARAAKCGGSCRDAADLQEAIDAVEQASNHVSTPASPPPAAGQGNS